MYGYDLNPYELELRKRIDRILRITNVVNIMHEIGRQKKEAQKELRELQGNESRLKQHLTKLDYYSGTVKRKL